jgi:hypothetical protein
VSCSCRPPGAEEIVSLAETIRDTARRQGERVIAVTLRTQLHFDTYLAKRKRRRRRRCASTRVPSARHRGVNWPWQGALAVLLTARTRP